MPLRLNVGLQKKIGLPDYGSLGASCHVEVELESTLIERDRDAFQRHVQNAFTACRQAVQDELARQSGNGHPVGQNGAHQPAETNGHGPANGESVRPASTPGSARPATKAQVRALHAIATRLQFDLTAELQRRMGIYRAEDLTLADASRLLTAVESGGGRRPKLEALVG